MVGWAGFYLLEDIWSGRRSRDCIPEAAWRHLRHALLGAALILLGWMSLSAARHSEELSLVMHEFLTTWPTARLTETFKLMSLHGLLLEYGLPDPQSSPPAHCAGGAEADGARGRRAATSLAPGAATEGVDSRRVPLLAAQH